MYLIRRQYIFVYYWRNEQAPKPLKHVKMYNENVSLSLRSKGHFLGPWAYARRVIFLSLSVHLNVHFLDPWVYAQSSVATKIENGPKTNTKILQFLKIDRRRIQRIFVNSKILRRSLKIANSSNIFEDTKIFKGKWKIFIVKNFLSDSNLNNFSQQ